MADTNIVREVGGQLVERIFSGILYFGIAVLAIGVIGFIMWWFLIYQRKFNITVKVISERAGDRNAVLFDKAAILRDRKDKSHFFRLWKLKLDLPSPMFNVLERTDKGDYLELYRTSENTIYFLAPSIIDKTRVVSEEGKDILIATQRSTQVNPNMEFWSAKRKGLNKKMLDTEKMWMKVLPFIPQIIGGVLTVFVLYILMSHLPGILAELTRLTSELRSLKGAEITTGLSWILT